jgi:hypothetical protein
MFDLRHCGGGSQSLARRPAQAAISAALNQFSSSKVKDALRFANTARRVGANACQPSYAKAKSQDSVIATAVQIGSPQIVEGYDLAWSI